MKYYVGCDTGNAGLRREVFQSAQRPTRESHGHLFVAVIGPFQTKCGAEFMARYGAGNPHCQTVDEAEQLALTAT
jgi:hypothetical protein